jgi:hypothetical protein
MKNIQMTLTKYFISCALPILIFGPNFGFGVFAEPPLYSSEAGSAQNDDKAGSMDKTGTANQSNNENTGSQEYTDKGTRGNLDTKENIRPNYE